jgi:hypothetical protein
MTAKHYSSPPSYDLVPCLGWPLGMFVNAPSERPITIAAAFFASILLFLASMRVDSSTFSLNV